MQPASNDNATQGTVRATTHATADGVADGVAHGSEQECSHGSVRDSAHGASHRLADETPHREQSAEQTAAQSRAQDSAAHNAAGAQTGAHTATASPVRASAASVRQVPTAPTINVLGRLRALIAPHCLVCGLRDTHAPGAPAAMGAVCGGCRHDFFAPASRCTQCGLRLAQGGRCGRCLREQPAYDATIALADYAPPVDGLVVALKFGHRMELAGLFGALLAERLAQLSVLDALLLPVPLAYERQSERGFNQAQEIARGIQRQLSCALLDNALLRTRHGVPQEALAADARRRNVRNAFAVASSAISAIAGRRVIVVDDVMTSGATLDVVAGVLKQAGAARVTNAIVARTA